jgi:hypothetical protein
MERRKDFFKLREFSPHYCCKRSSGPNNIEKSIVKKSKAIAGFLQYQRIMMS